MYAVQVIGFMHCQRMFSGVNEVEAFFDELIAQAAIGLLNSEF
jgi:hypothetical protein